MGKTINQLHNTNGSTKLNLCQVYNRRSFRNYILDKGKKANGRIGICNGGILPMQHGGFSLLDLGVVVC